MVLPGGKVIAGKTAAIAGGALVAVAGVTVGVLLMINGQKSYRTISVVDKVGEVAVSREGENGILDPYKGMALIAGDDVNVDRQSELDMKLDEDKYVYIEENTHMWLEADGDAENSQTVIYLNDGAVLNRIDNKLNAASYYKVETPNATMSIRGTVVRVAVYKDKDGIAHSDFAVLDGEVEVSLHTVDGEDVGKTITISQGFSCKTRGDEDFSEVVLQKITDGTPEGNKEVVLAKVAEDESGEKKLEGETVIEDDTVSVDTSADDTEKSTGDIDGAPVTEPESSAQINESSDEMAEVVPIKLSELSPQTHKNLSAIVLEGRDLYVGTRVVSRDDKHVFLEDPVYEQPVEPTPLPKVTPIPTKAPVPTPEPTKTPIQKIIEKILPKTEPTVAPTVIPINDEPEAEPEPASDETPTPGVTPTPEPAVYIVTFVDAAGGYFGEQEVIEGNKPVVPKLSPTQNGSWDDSINNVVTGDITISWTAQ